MSRVLRTICVLAGVFAVTACGQGQELTESSAAAAVTSPPTTAAPAQTGTSNGVRYSVLIRAVNAKGAGLVSSVAHAVPNAAPLGNHKPKAAGEIALPKDPRK